MASRRHPNLTADQRYEMAQAYVACRGPVRHRWDVIPSSPDDRPLFGTLLLLRCDNCGTYRRDIFSRVTGDLLARSYDHPDGYSDVDRHDAAWWRALFAETVRMRAPELLADAEENKATRKAAAKRAANVVPLANRKRA